MSDFRELAVGMCVLLVPLACIHFGARRFLFLELIGWFFLIGLVILGMLAQ